MISVYHSYSSLNNELKPCYLPDGSNMMIVACLFNVDPRLINKI